MRTAPLLLLIGCYPAPWSSDTGFQTTQVVPTGPLPERTLIRECDPVIRVATARSAYDFGQVDGHSEVYGDRSPDPFHVHLGWPSSDPSDSIAFLWHTDDDTLATMVELTPDGGPTQRFEGGSYVHSRRIHEVRICEGLEPGTAYTYRVGGEGHWSKEYRFTTPEPPGSFSDFRVVMMGDSRGSYEFLGELLAQVDATDPDFIVFTGDMVNSGSSQYEWDAWFDAGEDVLARRVLVPSHGNAEWLADNYFAQFSMPNNEEWFSIRYGDLHLVSLNDTVRLFGDIDEQAKYMQDVFAKTDAHWRVAAHHQPTWTSNTNHAGNSNLLAAWTPVFDQFGVQLALNGHNHFYERSVPIFDGVEAAPGQGTTYMVSGGAGAPLYTGYQDAWFREAVATVEHFVMVDFSASGMDGTAYDPQGNVLDTWQIPR